MSNLENNKNEQKKKESQDIPKEQLLKQTRIARGISLESIHEATKIPMDALKALEEGYNVRTLSPFYRKGFLKIYAEYLEIPAERVLDDEPLSKIRMRKITERKDDIGFWEKMSNGLTRKQKQIIVMVVGGLLALFLLIKLIGFVGGVLKGFSEYRSKTKTERIERKQNNKVKANIVPSQKSEKKTTAVVSQPKKVVQPKKNVPVVKTVASTPVAKTSASTSGIQTVTKKVTLTVRAQKDSWLRVKTDGNVVFQSTLQRGAVETWVANDQIEISGKNISQLEFEANGKMIGTLGRSDRKAKTVIVTQDGLSVTK